MGIPCRQLISRRRGDFPTLASASVEPEVLVGSCRKLSAGSPPGHDPGDVAPALFRFWLEKESGAGAAAGQGLLLTGISFRQFSRPSKGETLGGLAPSSFLVPLPGSSVHLWSPSGELLMEELTAGERG